MVAAVFTDIPDSDIDPESPITTSLMTAIRDNMKFNRAYTGTIQIHAKDEEPEGWFRCAGQTKDTTVEAVLFAVIAFTYGGSGANFNLPDYRGRLPAGLDNLGGTPANIITDAQADSIAGTLGSETHTQTGAEVGAHNHAQGYGAGGTGGAGAGALGEQLTGTSPAAAGANIIQPTIFQNFIIKN